MAWLTYEFAWQVVSSTHLSEKTGTVQAALTDSIFSSVGSFEQCAGRQHVFKALCPLMGLRHWNVCG